MTQNPFINALAASAYIALVALGISSIPPHEPMLRIFGPLLFLSLFVLSAAIVGYILLLEPGLMILRGQTREGITFFLKTIASFAVLTAIAGALALTF